MTTWHTSNTHALDQDDDLEILRGAAGRAAVPHPGTARQKKIHVSPKNNVFLK